MKHLLNRNSQLIIAVYFVQGAIIISGLAQFLLTRNVFKFSWMQLALLGSLAILTWSIKPIYGFLTDLVPFYGYRRKNYLILASLLTLFGYIGLSFLGVGFTSIAIAIILINIGLGFSDVIADGMIIDVATKKNVGWYQTMAWRAKAVGIFFGSLLSGLLLQRAVFSNLLENTTIPQRLSETFSAAFPVVEPVAGLTMIDVRFTFLITGLLPLIVLYFVYHIHEAKVDRKSLRQGHKDIPSTYIYSAGLAFLLTTVALLFIAPASTPLLGFVDNAGLSSLAITIIWGIWIIRYAFHLIQVKAASKVLLWGALFLFLWRFTPSFGAPWSDYFINTLALPQEKLGYIATLTPLAWLAGSFIYTRYLDQIKLQKVLLWTVLISAVLGLFQLIIASPELATTIGAWTPIKYLAGIILLPAYSIIYGFDAWGEVMTQAPLLNLDAVLTFILEAVFIIAFLPLLKLAALVTPKGVEATNFAVLMSIMNLGLAFGGIAGGWIYTAIEGTYSLANINFTGLHLTILIGALTSLICLSVIRKIKV